MESIVSLASSIDDTLHKEDSAIKRENNPAPVSIAFR
jgi:hypothetical protein